MFIWFKIISTWLLRNPMMIALTALLLTNGFYIVKSNYHKQRAETAIIRAEGAEEALRRVKVREEKLKGLEKKHRGEDEKIYRLIANRSYFSSL